MTYAFAKDSRACAVCQSWAGERELSADMTLACVPRYSVEGECRTAVSQDYGRVTKSYHTCESWSPMPLLRAHGARHSRTPGPSAAMAGLLAATPAEKRPAAPAPSPPAPPPPIPPAVVPPAATIPPAPVKPPPITVPARPPVAAPARPPVAAPAPAPVIVSTPATGVCASSPLDLEQIPPIAGVLLNYWRRLKGDRPMPATIEVNTAHLRDSLPRLCLFTPTAEDRAERPDFEYRACGRAVRRRLDLRPNGRTVGECHDPETAARLNADLRACLDDGAARAVLVRGDPLMPGQKYVELLLPLSDRGGRPAFVLAWRNVPGG